ncbi:saccharopine dehydrogenase NADP-binding domain-containing protein [Blastococcus sp. SYSU D00695]
MRVIALGGSGGMGRAALRVLAAEQRVDEVVVADLDEAGAAEVAAELRDLGQPATSRRVDVTDRAALLDLLAGADLVQNSVGPYSRFGVPVLEAAIDSGCRYLDLCDDAQPTLDMLALDGRAREAGVAAVIGAGASPGLMNVFARLAAEGMDRVDDVTVGWTLDNVHRGWDMMRASGEARSSGRGGYAALEHLLEQFSHSVPVYVDGELGRRRTRERVRFDVPGLGRGTGYSVGHPEPVTLPRTLGARGSSQSVCLMSSGRARLLVEVAAGLESGALDMAAAITRVAEGVGVPTTPDDDPEFPDCGDLPTYFVLLTGERDGRRVQQYTGCLSKPEPMSVGTGVPYGIATAALTSADLPAGVHPLDAVVADEPYLSQVARLWGVSREELCFTGSVPLPG